MLEYHICGGWTSPFIQTNNTVCRNIIAAVLNWKQNSVNMSPRINTGFPLFQHWYVLFTGIVEFLEPSEAKTAFTKLAYTKFKHLPLYLEWAPSDTFTTPPSKPKKGNRTVESSEGSDSVTSSSSTSSLVAVAVAGAAALLFIKIFISRHFRHSWWQNFFLSILP